VIGGYVGSDRSVPALRGRYVYSDLCEGVIRTLRPGLKRVNSDRRTGLQVESPTTFGQDDRGHLYVASGVGPVFRIVQR
jgi:hypothetical protein